MDLLGRRRRFSSRQALLFLVAIGAPCLLLAGLSLRMLAQERELAEKRVADDRRRLATDVRQELLGRLERLRLDALTAPAAGTARDPAIALVAQIDNGRLVLPWDRANATNTASPAAEDSAFGAAIRLGEHEELATHQFDRAVTAYRRALADARTPSHQAFARLLLARTLTKSDRFSEADDSYRAMLRLPLHVVDDQGIPFAMYAARRILDSRGMRDSDRHAVVDLIRTAIRNPALPPAAAYMLRDLAMDLRSSSEDSLAQTTAAVVDEIAAALQTLEHTLAIQAALPALMAKAREPSEGGNEPTWVPFGAHEMGWLVGVSSGNGAQTVVAVKAASVLSSPVALRPVSSGDNGHQEAAISIDGDGAIPLGDALPGLGLTFSTPEADAVADAAGLQRSFYLAALALVFGATISGGYLFWRDVRREVRVAQMGSQFVSSVSHELKTPLTAIRMFAETMLLGRSAGSAAPHEYLQTIVNESERLTRLLNNVLDFSKIEEGRKTYHLERQSLGLIVRAAAKAMEYPLLQHGFELRVDIEDDLPRVAADADAIEQAVLNLLSNAMKYSGDGRTIEMRVQKQGETAIISVTDCGLGIPPEEQHRIFEKFYRVAGPVHDRIPGTGLGLTLVDHIARAHGGSVTVESEPGKGSTFSITLPLAGAAV